MATKPFFIPQKEINLIDTMNEELIDEIVGQSVDIYKVSVDNTDVNMYGESTHKYFENAKSGDMTVTNKVVEEVLTLPLHSNMRSDYVKRVIDGIIGFFQNNK